MSTIAPSYFRKNLDPRNPMPPKYLTPISSSPDTSHHAALDPQRRPINPPTPEDSPRKPPAPLSRPGARISATANSAAHS